MVKQEDVIIVVPLYKERLNDLESISYEQLRKVLGGYDICFISPRRMKGRAISNDISTEYFDDDYFDSVKTYNNLMLDKYFYKRFSKYKYMLLYQLDAFVFRDNLLYFCNLGYDYIGAPWLEGQSQYKGEELKTCYVGNGGLSLRNIENSIKLLELEKDYLKEYKLNEDFFFSICECDSFSVAPIEIALQFSFEKNVKLCFALNNHTIPFGCHAWERYNIAFWKEYITEYGFSLPEYAIKEGNQDNVSLSNLSTEVKNKYDICKVVAQNNRDMMKIVEVPSDKKGIAIWGAGVWGKRIVDLIKRLGMRVDCFIDSAQTGSIDGIPIIGPDHIRKDYYIIVAVKQNHKEIEKYLCDVGCHEGKDYILYNKLIEVLYSSVEKGNIGEIKYNNSII